MDVAIAGGHGKVARRLARRLSGRGDRVRALIRKPDHADDVREDGSEPVICDIETADPREVADVIAGADAVVFAAGSGPGSGPERKLTVDRDGAIKLIDAARSAGVDRYVIISSIGAENPPDDDEVFSVYLRAKAAADQALMESGLDWTVVRPVYLNDEEGTDLVRLAPDPLDGRISRDDVAAVLAATLHEPATVRRLFYAGPGDQSVEQALAALVAG